mmetsp:Transcript_15687/g.49275  ORF Transcript_15687/g.49275 Transcript_15687/m.49275 type:complete len:523 (-) Transcript_15687:134-1702(-)
MSITMAPCPLVALRGCVAHCQVASSAPVGAQGRVPIISSRGSITLQRGRVLALSDSRPDALARGVQRFRCSAVAASSEVQMQEEMGGWLVQRGMPPISVVPATFNGRQGYAAAREVAPGEVVLEVPESLAITVADVQKDGTVAGVAEGQGELLGITLWLMAERAKGESSAWFPYLRSLPERTLSPITWAQEERSSLLKGSPVKAEADARVAALQEQWEAISPKLEADPAAFPSAVFSLANFLDAFSVVIANAVYLPSAECFAMLPVASSVRRVFGAPLLDYDFDRQSVTLSAAATYAAGDEVLAGELERRSNAELFLTYGVVEDENPADFMEISTSLVPSDRLYQAKKQVVEAEGFEAVQTFPVFADRIPVQLLAYLRLARLQDVAQLAKITFNKDTEVSQMNEYEVLNLLMSECRDKLDEYETDLEADYSFLKQDTISPRERAATELKMREKEVWIATMDGIRRRLAPIRGIPTKSGQMLDPNQDLIDIFDSIENIPNVPKQVLGGFTRWLSGKDDPDFRK